MPLSGTVWFTGSGGVISTCCPALGSFTMLCHDGTAWHIGMWNKLLINTCPIFKFYCQSCSYSIDVQVGDIEIYTKLHDCL